MTGQGSTEVAITTVTPKGHAEGFCFTVWSINSAINLSRITKCSWNLFTCASCLHGLQKREEGGEKPYKIAEMGAMWIENVYIHIYILFWEQAFEMHEVYFKPPFAVLEQDNICWDFCWNEKVSESEIKYDRCAWKDFCSSLWKGSEGFQFSKLLPFRNRVFSHCFQQQFLKQNTCILS